MVLVLAAAVMVTITRNWNAWEGGHTEQRTDDAYVRGDLTPLSTKVPGIVREVLVNDYQSVHKGAVLVQLDDDDYSAQVSQAEAGVEAATAALENNRRQRELQDARIDKSLAGIDQARAQIAAAQAGKQAVQADVIRTRAERSRQESLLKTNSATPQRAELAVADEQRFDAQEASREADLDQARTMLHSNEIGVEADRRAKVVLESQEAQPVADLHAKEAGLSCCAPSHPTPAPVFAVAARCSKGGGCGFLLIAKFVPGLDGISPPLAGMLGASRMAFMTHDAGGAALWVGFYTFCGFVFARQLDQVARSIPVIATWIVAFLAIPPLLFFILKLSRLYLMIRQLRPLYITPKMLRSELAATRKGGGRRLTPVRGRYGGNCWYSRSSADRSPRTQA
jgi:hypothetical protein